MRAKYSKQNRYKLKREGVKTILAGYIIRYKRIAVLVFLVLRSWKEKYDGWPKSLMKSDRMKKP